MKEKPVYCLEENSSQNDDTNDPNGTEEEEEVDYPDVLRLDGGPYDDLKAKLRKLYKSRLAFSGKFTVSKEEAFDFFGLLEQLMETHPGEWPSSLHK